LESGIFVPLMKNRITGWRIKEAVHKLGCHKKESHIPIKENKSNLYSNPLKQNGFCKKMIHLIHWLSITFFICSSSDFGSIFSTLLPGTMAKLEPPEGCSFLDGLEVRVAFGSVWKQSLSELSGGQRSLLALSLILALLLFKPAPLYILDEVCFSM